MRTSSIYTNKCQTKQYSLINKKQTDEFISKDYGRIKSGHES